MDSGALCNKKIGTLLITDSCLAAFIFRCRHYGFQIFVALLFVPTKVSDLVLHILPEVDFPLIFRIPVDLWFDVSVNLL